jgi:RNA polymerase sigma-70 factor, ECF subfamily
VTSWLERIGRDSVPLPDAPTSTFSRHPQDEGTADRPAEASARPGSRAGRFTELYREHYPFVLRYTLRRLRGLDAAQDATVATFAVVWSRFDEAPELPRAWIYRIARSIVSLELRQRIRDERVPGAPGTSRLRLADHEIEDDPVLRALSELQEDDREVLLLRAWENLSGAEIGEVLGCSPNDAAVRLHEAQHRLKELLSSAARREATGQSVAAPSAARRRRATASTERRRRGGSVTGRLPRD